MKCQKCNKNEANVQYRETVNGVTREICLCSDCAKETGILDRTEGLFAGMEREMMSAFARPFAPLGLTGSFFASPLIGGAAYPAGKGLFDLSMPEIGEFFETGSAKESTAREGEKIDSKPEADTVDSLKSQLLDAIADERYEDAAKLRDKIKQLKGE